MGRLLMCLPRLSLAQLRPTAPMGKLLTRLPRLLLAQLLRLTLRSTTVCTCRRGLNFSHRPDGKMADVLAPTHACTTANASVNYSLYAPQRPRIFSGKCLLTCPNRFSSFNLDRSCSTRDEYVPATPAKVPVAPMGDSCFAHCLQGGGVYVSSGTVTITSSSITGNTAYYVCAHVLKFPSPQWENC